MSVINNTTNPSPQDVYMEMQKIDESLKQDGVPSAQISELTGVAQTFHHDIGQDRIQHTSEHDTLKHYDQILEGVRNEKNLKNPSNVNSLLDELHRVANKTYGSSTFPTSDSEPLPHQGQILNYFREPGNVPQPPTNSGSAIFNGDPNYTAGPGMGKYSISSNGDIVTTSESQTPTNTMSYKKKVGNIHDGHVAADIAKTGGTSQNATAVLKFAKSEYGLVPKSQSAKPSDNGLTEIGNFLLDSQGNVNEYKMTSSGDITAGASMNHIGKVGDGRLEDEIIKDGGSSADFDKILAAAKDKYGIVPKQQ